MQSLRALINGDELVVAPLVLNPIMARLARDCGFKAGYISGGSLGWQQCVTEANITLPEMAQVALDMRAACDLPQPVRTAHTAITGTPVSSMVRRGPSRMKSAPAASAREARCITSSWGMSL